MPLLNVLPHAIAFPAGKGQSMKLANGLPILTSMFPGIPPFEMYGGHVEGRPPTYKPKTMVRPQKFSQLLVFPEMSVIAPVKAR